MGIGPQYRHKYSCNCPPSKVMAPNPDPKKFRIKLTHQINNFVIVEINYEGATNFEGNKILVYKNITKAEIYKLKEIDPHFSKTGIAPVARFIPTEEGMMMAVKFCMSASIVD